MVLTVEWSPYFLKQEHPSQENQENKRFIDQKKSSLHFDE